MERDLWEYLKTAKKPIVLYGMGNGADKIIAVLEQKGIEYKGVFASDGFVRNKLFHGLPVESYAALKERFGDMIVLLCFGTHLPEVMENIKKIALEQELYAPDVPVIGGGLFDSAYYRAFEGDFNSVYKLLCDGLSQKTFLNTVKYKISGKTEYLFGCEADFSEPYGSILNPQDGEIILDLGAYNGDTAMEFAARFPKNGRIIAVEPDKKTYKKLVANTEKYSNIECRNLCVSSFSGVGQFAMNGGRNSVVGKGQEVAFSTVDGILKGERVTLIKMDIEGEELNAIRGAENTIKKYAPKMIISAYHRNEDLLTLPKAVLEINPEYRVYMRHFASLPAWDTVYYFV